MLPSAPLKYECTVNPSKLSDTQSSIIHFTGMHKRVLDIGCGPGSITQYLHTYNHCTIDAIEIDQQALEKVKPFAKSAFSFDLNNPQWIDHFVNNNLSYDVIMATDVLEHLYDPATTLQQAKKLLNKDGYLVISLPNTSHNGVIASLYHGNLEYRETGLLDKTHIRFFSIYNIQKLFDQCGLHIVDASFTILHPKRTEFKKTWKTLPWFIKIALGYNQFGNVYQVIIKAVPSDRTKNSLNLSMMPIASPQSSFARSLSRIWRRFNNPR